MPKGVAHLLVDVLLEAGVHEFHRGMAGRLHLTCKMLCVLDQQSLEGEITA
jgi:hypothetical protein